MQAPQLQPVGHMARLAAAQITKDSICEHHVSCTPVAMQGPGGGGGCLMQGSKCTLHQPEQSVIAAVNMNCLLPSSLLRLTCEGQ
jgi:hypothetical protein